MVRKFIVIILFGFSLLLFSSSVSAETLSDSVKSCLALGSAFNCSANRLPMIECLNNVPASDLVWSCSDMNDDFYVDTKEIISCANYTAKYLCENIPPYGAFGGRCQGLCVGSVEDQTRLKTIFHEKYNERTPRLTLTPTPTPPRGSVGETDVCTKNLLLSKSCYDNFVMLDACYEAIPPEDGLWSCMQTNGIELEDEKCADAYIKRVRSNVISTLKVACDGPQTSFGTGRSLSYENFRYHFLITRKKRLASTISPTPGVLDPRYVEDDENVDRNDLDELKSLLNCGFSNAGDDEKEKRQCCSNIVTNTIPNFESSEYDDNGDGNWFTRITVGQVKNNIRNRIATDMTERVNGINGILNQDGQAMLKPCYVGDPIVTDTESGVCTCQAPGAAALCKYTEGDSAANKACIACLENNDDKDPETPKKFFTAIGCIDTSPAGIIQEVFTRGIGLAGLVAMGCIIYSAFMMQMSQGNPEQIQKAQEQITSCITGLILIILSIFILRVIGVDILRIPGFS